MEWYLFLEKGLMFGFAALGFAILFNVPLRTLFPVFLMAALGGITKLLMVQLQVNVIVATLMGAGVIGMLSIPIAHKNHAPPPIFSIPAVIPMVPGIFAYRMMLGLMRLAGDIDPKTYNQVLGETIHNGLKVMFILMSLAIGVGLPMLVTRKESAKEIRFRKPGLRTQRAAVTARRSVKK